MRKVRFTNFQIYTTKRQILLKLKNMLHDIHTNSAELTIYLSNGHDGYIKLKY